MEYLKCIKTAWRPELRPGPRWGREAYSDPPDLLAGGEGPRWIAAPPLLKNPTLAVGPLGLELRLYTRLAFLPLILMTDCVTDRLPCTEDCCRNEQKLEL